MKPLSIGMVCFPSLGGSAVVASELAAGLARRGHRVHLLARDRPSRLDPDRDKVTFHRVELADYPLFEHPPYTMGLASQLVDLTLAHKLDVLHVHYAVPHAASAYLARQALGSKAPRIFTSLHGSDVLRVGSHPAYRSLTRFVVAQSDAVIVPSEYLKGQAMRLLELPRSLEIDVVPNFVDTARFAPRRAEKAEKKGNGGGPKLLHVSNFRPVKRVRDVIDVLSRVRRELPATLTLVGDGPERDVAELHTRALELTDHVQFVGRRTEFLDLLREADAFILPSEVESFGVAALEALSTGVPVFGYRVGGLPELVTEDVGRLVTPFDADALGAAVVEVLRQPQLHNAMSTAARRRALEHYQSSIALDRYEAILERR